MALSSLLLGATSKGGELRKAKPIDKELDALFRSSVSKIQKPDTALPITTVGSTKDLGAKRKLGDENTTNIGRSTESNGGANGLTRKRKRIDGETPKKAKLETKSGTDGGRLSDKGKAKTTPKQIKEKDEWNDDNACLEDSYHTRKVTDVENPHQDVSDADTEGDPTQLVHESLSASRSTGSRSGAKPKYTPAGETPQRRDLRTIFVGNLPLEVAQKRPLLKQLQRHILAQTTLAKIESTRFRSVPFQNPTAKLPTAEDDGASEKHLPILPSAKQSRPHDRDRISSWREQKRDNDNINKTDEKKFLTPQQKRKIAFIHQEFHSDADTVNAYIVFAHAPPIDSRPPNLPPPPPTMDPYEAAKLAVEKCDGSIFMGRRIRVDHVNKSGPPNRDKTNDKISANEGDPKLSVFVGNLDFASKEDDLREYFEGIVSAERGPPPFVEDSEDNEDTGGEKGMENWVTRVRIIRDKDTQLGKGFAYVQFADRECVDEVLSLEATKLKFAKRKLRVQRCKTIPGGSSTLRPRPIVPGPTHRLAGTSVPTIPKGDPALGEKLAHLPKQARKEYKSSDADRVARRLAKKKARIALEKDGVKLGVNLKDRRHRVRKDSAVKKGLSAPRKEMKRRVRSQESLAKRNMKK